MKLSFKIGCVVALVSLGGCLSDPDDSHANPSTPASTRQADLARWAASAALSLPGDSNLATGPLRDRWDSVANLSRYRDDARWALSGLLPPAGAAHGKLDTIVSPDQSEALAAALPQLVYSRFETMNHTSFLSEPLQSFSMALALQNFLKGQWAGR